MLKFGFVTKILPPAPSKGGDFKLLLSKNESHLEYLVGKNEKLFLKDFRVDSKKNSFSCLPLTIHDILFQKQAHARSEFKKSVSKMAHRAT